MPKHCPKCASLDISSIGDYALYLTVNDTVTYIQYLCLNCDYEWSY